ncbi:hypothetical protein ACFOYU_10420 [Microvirga sp. GCM10011540]|uniref:hypothetical protein n=1 Tax=Microvirga sp. GCM10011540 TaxID=3317338 RepID=UPI0036207E90
MNGFSDEREAQGISIDRVRRLGLLLFEDAPDAVKRACLSGGDILSGPPSQMIASLLESMFNRSDGGLHALPHDFVDALTRHSRVPYRLLH